LKLLCDEGVERQVVKALRAGGHDVSYVAEMAPGISDREVLSVAAEEGRILLTADKDFGELVFRQGRAHHGILLLRLHGLRLVEKASMVAAAVEEHAEDLSGAFSVLERGRLRVRRPPIVP